MIIWNGLGILIPLLAVGGIIFGFIVGETVGQPAIGPAFGLGVAAFANWFLWKLIYPKQPKILIDPATGQQVILNPKHGLFFIPAKAWTWILAILTLPTLFIGILGEKGEAREKAKPGHAAFSAADDLIDSKSKGLVHGNTDAAKVAATDFASMMKSLTGVIFSGGNKKNLMTGGDFLTYCQEGQENIVFLCHVPSLRSYKSEETKTGLAKIAWSAAIGAAKNLDPEGKKTLFVGLRGIVSYGSIQKGNLHDDLTPIQLDSSDQSVFYPLFLETKLSVP